MQIDCTTCSRWILDKDINLERMLAKCRGCNAVVDLRDQNRLKGASRPSKRERSSEPVPEAITILEDSTPKMSAYRAAANVGGNLVLVRRWFSPGYYMMLLICIAWGSLMVFVFPKIAMNRENGVFDRILSYGFLFMQGSFLIYYTIAGFINSTLISVNGGELTIRHGPLPWIGNRQIQTRAIKQLYYKAQGTANRNRSYRLDAIVEGGQKVRLVSLLPTLDQATFLKEKLARRLRLVDIAVVGEYQR